jgi:hypothetical protein
MRVWGGGGYFDNCVGVLVMCILVFLGFVLFVLCLFYCFVDVYVFLIGLSVLPPGYISIVVNNNNNNL